MNSIPTDKASTDGATRKELDDFWRAIAALTPQPSAEQMLSRTSNGYSLRQIKRNIGGVMEDVAELTDLQFHSVVGSSRVTTNHFHSVPVDPATNAPYLFGAERERHVGFGSTLNYNVRAYQELLAAGLLADAQAIIDAADEGVLVQSLTCKTYLPPPSEWQLETASDPYGMGRSLVPEEVVRATLVNVGGFQLIRPEFIYSQTTPNWQGEAGKWEWNTNINPNTGMSHPTAHHLLDGDDGSAVTVDNATKGLTSRFWARRLFDPTDYTSSGHQKHYIRIAQIYPHWRYIYSPT
jgi:hypothetical protein